jgi:phenylpropionate dioxygenase-like ring-hydroxylating dioxygenase large terminal subunit
MIDDPVLVHDWHIVARSTDIAAGEIKAASLLEEDLVLWRTGDHLLAWKDLCVHRGARLSGGAVSGERLACPYHGWEYEPSGQVARFPAHPEQVPPPKARAISYLVKEQYGLVWVCLGKPEKEIPAFPEWDDPSFRKVFCGPYTLRASGPRAIENFLDVAHFPFVHGGLLGDAARPEVFDYEAEINEEGVIARDVRIFQPDPDASGQGGVVSYTYRVLRPLAAYFTKTSAGPRFAAFFAISPVAEKLSVGWLVLALNYRHEAPDAELSGFEDAIMAQDIPVVESQRPELLPLDLQAELHLRSDRVAIAYRQYLKKVGLRLGIA